MPSTRLPWWSTFLLAFAAYSALAQAPSEFQSLWDELSAKWSAKDLAGAELAADALVAALEPSAKDFFPRGAAQLRPAQPGLATPHPRQLRRSRGHLLASVAQAPEIDLPAGLTAQAAPQMRAMVDDRVRLGLRGLVNFYLAVGDLERATEAFEEAIAIVPLWKRQARKNPAFSYQVLAAAVRLAGHFVLSRRSSR